MIEINRIAKLFAPGATINARIPREVLPVAAGYRIAFTDGLANCYVDCTIDDGGVLLELDTSVLTRAVQESLTKALASIPGVVPADAKWTDDGEMSMRLSLPDSRRDDMLLWDLADDLTVTHCGSAGGEIDVASGLNEVLLDHSRARDLLEALAGWRAVDEVLGTVTDAALAMMCRHANPLAAHRHVAVPAATADLPWADVSANPTIIEFPQYPREPAPRRSITFQWPISTDADDCSLILALSCEHVPRAKAYVAYLQNVVLTAGTTSGRGGHLTEFYRRDTARYSKAALEAFGQDVLERLRHGIDQPAVEEYVRGAHDPRNEYR